jgi:hypothetical protein
MSRIIAILFIKSFYEKNAAFFLLLILGMFGIMSAADTVYFHLSLMRSIATAPLACAIFMLVCLLYTHKCLAHATDKATAWEHDFLRELRVINDAQQVRLYLNVGCAIYLPMLVYATGVTFVCLQQGSYATACVVVGGQLVSIAAIPYLIWRAVNKAATSSFFNGLPRLPSLPSSAYSFTFQYLWVRKRGSVLGIKVFSLALLQFLVLLNSTGIQKENFCFVTLLSTSAHALLPYYIVRFWETELGFVRALPIQLVKKVSYWAVAYAVLLLPELAFMLLNNPNQVPKSTLCAYYALELSSLLLLTALQYIPKMTFNTYSGVVFVLFFVPLMVLTSVSAWLYSAAVLAIAAILFHCYYPRYELELSSVVSA